MSSFRLGKYKLYCETPPAPVGHFALFAEIQNLKYQPVPPTHPHQSLCSLTQTSLFLIIDELPNHPRPLLVQVQLSCKSGCLMEQSSLTSATAVGHCLPVPLVLVSLAWGWMAFEPLFLRCELLPGGASCVWFCSGSSPASVLTDACAMFSRLYLCKLPPFCSQS